ncbi:carboxylesterase/lipase family protein [Paenarthrobacter sp. NPDC091669]|uniref:carboxylesterase/lipase family protein n=1 Tax=Paenarthrobacter sp. NPDC091669 TaxID=3364384 RepID=UPI00380DC6FD
MSAVKPTVVTESGIVRGIVETGIAAFRGVPYAASPIGHLRFAPPQPHPSWSDVRDASRSGPAVPQDPSRLEAVMGPRTPVWDEDGSLSLNIWTPELPLETSPERKLPVLLWFHGGGFTSGSGGWDWYDGRNLSAAGEIIVVTANYRLGPLGFLYLPELGIDNLGLQDQAAALAWIRRNIQSFGGNPEDITLGGQSAGAFSSIYLAASPASGPLINKIICQSAPMGLAPQQPEMAAKHARRFVDILGLSRSLDLMGELRRLPVEDLLLAYRQLAGELSVPGNVAPPMYPVLGASQIPRTWERALADGCLDGKQLLIGTTKNEMSAFLAFDSRIQALGADQARYLAATLVDGGSGSYDRAGAGDHNAVPSDVLTQIMTEAVFRNGTLLFADHQSAGGHDTYVYQFNYAPAHDRAHLGAVHCVDLPFFFDTMDAYADSPMLGQLTDEDRELARTFAQAVAGFVATGSPNDERWLPYVAGNPETVRHFP